MISPDTDASETLSAYRDLIASSSMETFHISSRYIQQDIIAQWNEQLDHRLTSRNVLNLVYVRGRTMLLKAVGIGEHGKGLMRYAG